MRHCGRHCRRAGWGEQGRAAAWISEPEPPELAQCLRSSSEEAGAGSRCGRGCGCCHLVSTY